MKLLQNKYICITKGDMIKRLTELLPGQQGIINAFGETELTIKLMEMGCVPGEMVRIDKIAPLGDPISILVAGYHLSLRLNEAEHILVETETN
jgi:ferrous iron transport protein A